MTELGTAEPLLPYLQKFYNIDILVPMLNNHLPSLATRIALVLTLTFFADPGVWHLSAHH